MSRSPLIIAIIVLLLCVACAPTESGPAISQEGEDAEPASSSEGDAVQLADLPSYKGAQKDEGASAELTQSLSQIEGQTEVAVFTSSDSPSKVIAFYRQKMQAQGWEETMAFAAEEGGFVAWEKGAQGFQIAVGEDQGQTMIMVGLGPADADLLQGQSIGSDATVTPEPTRTPTLTPTETALPEGITAKEGYPVALEEAKTWVSDPLLIDTGFDPPLFGPETVDEEGKGPRWRYTFGIADAQSDEEGSRRFEVWVTAKGVEESEERMGMYPISEASAVANVADWTIDSPQAVAAAEEAGGKAWREEQEGEVWIHPDLYLVTWGQTRGASKGAVWHVQYGQLPMNPDVRSPTYFVDATTGEVLGTR